MNSRIVITSILSIAALHCGSGESTPPALPPPADVRPPSQLDRFVTATNSYTASVALLRRVPPAEDHRGVRQTLHLLADAIDEMPFVDRAATRQAADLMKNEWVKWSGIATPSQSPAAGAKQSLAYALGVFRLAAHDARVAAALKKPIEELGSSVALLDPEEELDGQHELVLDALAKASDVLRVLAKEGPSRGRLRGSKRSE